MHSASRSHRPDPISTRSSPSSPSVPIDRSGSPERLPALPESGLQREVLDLPSPVPAPTRTGPSVLKAWQAEVAERAVELDYLTIGLKAVSRQRRLAVQLAAVRHIDGSGAHLGSAVLRCHRVIAGLEAHLQRRFRLLVGDLECARELLTPRVLLAQAQKEWQVLQERLETSDRDPDQLLRLNQKRELLLSRLLDIAAALHPGVPMPGVCTWIEQRAHDLERERRLLFDDLGFDPSCL